MLVLLAILRELWLQMFASVLLDIMIKGIQQKLVHNAIIRVKLVLVQNLQIVVHVIVHEQ